MAKESTLHRIFCQNVCARRRTIGLTQVQVAERLNVSQASYAQIESGRTCPSLAVVEKVATALETNAWELLRSYKPVAAE